MLNSGVTHVKSLFLLQKRAIRLTNKVGSREHTNQLFIKSQVMKFKDLVDLNILLIMYKAKSRSLPINIQKLFNFNDSQEGNRRKKNFKSQFACTTIKQRCISVYGVKVWNSLNDLKSCLSNTGFKNMYIKKYLLNMS